MILYRLSDDSLGLAPASTVDYDFVVAMPTRTGHEVLLGRNVHVFLSSEGAGAAQNMNMLVFYSHDFGATFTNRNTSDLIPANGVFAGLVPAIGTNIRIRVDAPDGGTLTSSLHLA